MKTTAVREDGSHQGRVTGRPGRLEGQAEGSGWAPGAGDMERPVT